jgi:NAD(P)H dehydrogenase (quinone)
MHTHALRSASVSWATRRQVEARQPLLVRGADLAAYAMGQSADPAVRAFQARIDAAQQLVFEFPIWWEVMPALLKGFVDKVFAKG